MSISIDLSGQTALVTGASRGIGAAIAETLARAGADVVGVSASLPLEGSETGRAVEAAGRRFTAHQCDFADRAATLAFLERLEADGPAIDILVNNAGLIRRAPAEEHGIEDWDLVIETNLSAPFILTQRIGRQMLERGRGRVIFIASLLSFQGGILVPGYAAAKGGVAQITRAFANEWAGRGVNVNAVAPGYVRTENTRPLQDDPERSEALMARVPAGRWGAAEDIAGPVLFLASPLSSFVHGEVLVADGGWMAR
jgi:2-deoxy-D-gluconate 3-dehydrogenase